MLLERVNLHRLGRVAAAVVVAGTLWGCDDPNLFEPRTVAPPEIVGLSAPAEVRSGETLDVRVRAIGELRIDSISVKVRGAFNAEKALLVASSGLSDVVADASFEVPDVISDTLAVVSAVARVQRRNH